MADLSTYGLDPSLLQAAFLKWLEQWKDRPISLGSDFSVFAQRDGVVLAVERLPSVGEAPIFRLSAVRVEPEMRIEVVMEIDGRTWEPRLQCVRFETPPRVLEFRMTVETLHVVSRSAVPRSLFRPEEWIPRSRAIARGEALGRLSPSRRVPSVISPAPIDLEGLEMKILYALHRMRTCLGEPVEVIREPTGGIRVQGLARTEERKAELLATLSALDHASSVSADIQSMTEAASPVAEPLHPSGEQIEIRSGRLPIEEHLEAYFHERATAGGGDSIGPRITKLASDAVLGGEAALAEAWALRHLAQRYPAHKIHDLDSDSQRLLETMLRDHMAALWTVVAGIRQAIEPALSPLAERQARQGKRLTGATKREPSESGQYGPHSPTFDTVWRINELLQALFAAGELPAMPATSAEDRPRLPLKTPEESAADILQAFHALEDDFRELDAEVGRILLGAEQARSGARALEP